jgi:hypothetical protein
MSSGPTLTGDTCIEVTKKRYINIDFGPEQWCTYKGECKRRHLVFNQDEVCDLCKYRKPLDIPSMIEKRLKEVKK